MSDIDILPHEKQFSEYVKIIEHLKKQNQDHPICPYSYGKGEAFMNKKLTDLLKEEIIILKKAGIISRSSMIIKALQCVPYMPPNNRSELLDFLFQDSRPLKRPFRLFHNSFALIRFFHRLVVSQDF